MPGLIEQHRTEIKALCRGYCVGRLDVGGSVVRDDSDLEPRDVDFLARVASHPASHGFHDQQDLPDRLACPPDS